MNDKLYSIIDILNRNNLDFKSIIFIVYITNFIVNNPDQVPQLPVK